MMLLPQQINSLPAKQGYFERGSSGHIWLKIGSFSNIIGLDTIKEISTDKTLYQKMMDMKVGDRLEIEMDIRLKV